MTKGLDPNTIFSAGLGKRGRIAAWGVALLGAGIWTYMENRQNGQQFSSVDVEIWNKEKKAAADKKEKAQK